MEKAKFECYLTGDTHVKVVDGNRKVGKGIYCVNLLAGDEPLRKKDGTLLCNIPGTCGGCCENCKESCYAIRTQLRHNNRIPTWARNTLLAVHETETFFKEIQQFLDRSMVSAVRFHAFGEIPNEEYLLCMCELAKANPRVQFYTYTKRFEWVGNHLRFFGSFPENLAVNVSIWNGNYSNPYGLPEFIYDDGSDPSLKDIVHCPAVDKNGHETGVTCAKCRRCLYAKNGQKTAVYAH